MSSIINKQAAVVVAVGVVVVVVVGRVLFRLVLGGVSAAAAACGCVGGINNGIAFSKGDRAWLRYWNWVFLLLSLSLSLSWCSVIMTNLIFTKIE